MQATDEEIKQYSSLSSVFIESIASIVTQFERAVHIESDDFYIYLSGEGIEVRHADGWRAGFIKQYDDWFLFVPDQKELFKA